jgi:hypothetical protein
MWKSGRNAINLITQGDGNLRKPLGKRHCQSANRKYKWMQDSVSVYNNENEVIKRHKIKIRSRREITFKEEYLIVRDVPKCAAPAEIPKDWKMSVVKELGIRHPKLTKIIDDILIQVPETLKYLTTNLNIKNANSFNHAVTSAKEITFVSDGGIRNRGGFGWVASSEEEIIATCHRVVRGKIAGMSSFRTKAPECTQV